ncbi:isochorismate synthase [Streptomyces cinnamoneus]|uniref:isochorismate synthase n=1 Tax=Streptomyces cinnamoneus TaxID=53446 RepID=A0A2G1XAX9_STRCJ|nr:isochorismate synthase DhbC [Streptomyces cinnamoneus]PHQ48376.1 isochorismate synthase [Streptomyces cinnamoneus]PPT16802.1 isochorismate synthase [Streptomyces cinnamoneus]
MPADRDATVGAATSLLDAYEPGRARFFASPTRTLLAHGARAHVPHGDAPLARRVAETLDAELLAGNAAPVVVGAVPFDHTAPAALAVPEAVRWAPPLAEDPLVALPAAPPAPAAWDVRPVPEPGVYGDAVAEAVRRMNRGEFSKVVLARTLELRSSRDLDLPALLQRLARRDPTGYTFAVPSGPGRTLLGASPELLVSRRGGRLVANPLAGSTPRSADLAEDVRRAAALLESAKDLHEHAVVVDAVRAALAPYCRTLEVPARPTLVRTATMWHLSTTVTGEPADPAVSALELASALHPTPAVCGTPTATARDVIGELEPFDRGFFTGMVGWGDANGDGEWVVTIRCAEAAERSLRLYAGAGVVAQSSPEAETAETGAKFQTFLQAVGVDQ